MSALRASSTSPKQPSLKVSAKVAKKKLHVSGVLVFGLAAIQVLSIILSIETASGVYRISDLKNERTQLETQADIIGSRVNSLSSNQNLVNVANALGLVSNVNPVFLRLEDAKVIGKPRRAQANERTVSKNLVPNASMTADTNLVTLNDQSTGDMLVSSETSANRSGTIAASPTY
jgi:cell division protein FtsL